MGIENTQSIPADSPRVEGGAIKISERRTIGDLVADANANFDRTVAAAGDHVVLDAETSGDTPGREHVAATAEKLGFGGPGRWTSQLRNA